MFKAEPQKKRATYYSIKEGSFRLPTDKEDPEAVRREYTNPKTKEEGVAYERVFKALYGIISDISFTENTLKDGTVLKSINIVLGEDEAGIAQIVSVGTNSRFASDFLKKLPAIDLSRPVCLMPYDFEPKDGGPRRVGISITHQNPDTDTFDVKIQNFFVKAEEKDGKMTYTNLHGLPEATEEDREDWEFFYKKEAKFLINYAKTHIIPQFNGERAATGQIGGNKEPLDAVLDDAPNPDEIPF